MTGYDSIRARCVEYGNASLNPKEQRSLYGVERMTGVSFPTSRSIHGRSATGLLLPLAASITLTLWRFRKVSI